MSDKVIFWLYDFSILLRKDKFYDFFPTKSMTKVEHLNSLTRGALILSCLLSFLKNDIRYISIFVATLVLTYLIHIYENNPDN